MLLRRKSRNVALGGILTALALVFMLVSSAIPTGRLVFVFLASAMIGIGVNVSGKAFGALVYCASALLVGFVVPDKLFALLYILVVGNYPLLKPFLERIGPVVVRFVAKLIVFNIYMSVCYCIAKFLLKLPMDIVYPLYLLWLMMVACFFVYDYAYSIFMQKIYNVIKLK